MHLSLALAALVATAHAIPAVKLVERAPRIITVTEVVNVWTTVTVTGTESPNAAPTVKDFHRGGRKKPSSVPAVNTPAPEPVPSPQAPAPAPEPAAPKEPEPAPAPAASSPAAPAPGSSQGGTSGGSAPNAYAQTVVDEHNVHRDNHSAPAMVWSQALADTAKKIAETCHYGHSMNVDGGNYGQNIAAGAPVNAIGRVITEQFYNGEVNKFTHYGEAQPADFDANFEAYGHFTQVVWVGSTSVGCYTADCTGKGLSGVAGNVPGIYHVCNYKPAGNFMGQFDKNVLRSKNAVTHHAK